jgi:hypothetical protein
VTTPDAAVGTPPPGDDAPRAAAEGPVVDGPVRTVQLAGGTVLSVRPARPSDVPALADLYRELPPEDRRRRFFTACGPGPQFLERWVRLAERGGACLVAEVTVPGTGVSHLVGDAGFSLLEDGDGELAITVARGSRGWLSLFLLDALVEAAAARGVPNLQAEIMAENAPMLALTRARGHAVLDHTDPTVVRVSIATTGRTPSWPGPHDRPRVLVELSGAWHAERAARRADYDVICCPGPPPHASGRCPLVEGDGCPLVEGADAVVALVRPGDEFATRLLDAHRAHGTAVPVVAEVWPETAGTARTWDPAALEIAATSSPSEVVAALQALLRPPPVADDAGDVGNGATGSAGSAGSAGTSRPPAESPSA